MTTLNGHWLIEVSETTTPVSGVSIPLPDGRWVSAAVVRGEGVDAPTQALGQWIDRVSNERDATGTDGQWWPLVKSLRSKLLPLSRTVVKIEVDDPNIPFSHGGGAGWYVTETGEGSGRWYVRVLWVSVLGRGEAKACGVECCDATFPTAAEAEGHEAEHKCVCSRGLTACRWDGQCRDVSPLVDDVRQFVNLFQNDADTVLADWAQRFGRALEAEAEAETEAETETE